MLGLNPWFKIWVAPKETLRAVVDYDPKHRFTTLSFIYGFLWMLSMCQTISLGHFYGVIAITVASIILAIPVGYILMSISTLFFLWTGKLFRGKANFFEVRAAVAWANVPSLVTIVTWIIMMVAYGSRLFMADKGKIEPSFGLPDVIFIIQLVIAIWAIVILIFGIAEVQRFSAWRAFGNFLVVVCIWVLLTFLAMYLIAYFSHALLNLNYL